VTAPVPAEAATGPATPPGTGSAAGGTVAAKQVTGAGGDVLVTLPTGEKVKVGHDGTAPRVTLGRGVTAVVHRVGDQVYVVPSGAVPSLVSGRLKRESFEVTGLAAKAAGRAVATRDTTAAKASGVNGSATVTTKGSAAASATEKQCAVEVRILNRQGKPAGPTAWDVEAFRLGSDYIYSNSAATNGKDSVRFALPCGRWNFSTEIFTENGDREELDLLLKPDVDVTAQSADATGATIVVLDARTAVPSSLNVSGLGPMTRRNAVQGWSWEMKNSAVSSVPGVNPQTDVYVTPVTAEEPGLSFTQIVSYRRPDGSLVLDGASRTTAFDVTMLTPDEGLQGTHPLDLRTIAPAQSAALPPGVFALAKVGGGDGFPDGERAVEAAILRKAAGAILWSPVDGSKSLTLWSSPGLPVVAVSHGAALAAAVGTGTVRATATVDQFSHPVVDLARQVVGKIPASPTVTYPASGLARVRQVYHPQPDRRIGVSSRYSGRGIALDSSSFIRFGTSRVDYVSPDFPWEESVTRGPADSLWTSWNSVAPQTFQAGKEVREDWGAPVQRSSLVTDPVNRWVFRVFGNWFAGSPSHWTDAAGHPSRGGEDQVETKTVRLTSEGKEIVTGADDGTLWTEILPGTHVYELAYDVARKPGQGMKGMRARTVWTFPLTPNDLPGDPEDTLSGAVVPMLSVDPRVPVDAAGTVPSGTAVSFDVNASIVNTPSPRVETMKVWTWAEGTADSARTPATSVVRVDADTFRVTITTPKAQAGTAVGLRIAATGSKDTAIDQTLDAAFALR
jgi:hypothetical protein